MISIFDNPSFLTQAQSIKSYVDTEDFLCHRMNSDGKLVERGWFSRSVTIVLNFFGVITKNSLYADMMMELFRKNIQKEQTSSTIANIAPSEQTEVASFFSESCRGYYHRFAIWDHIPFIFSVIEELTKSRTLEVQALAIKQLDIMVQEGKRSYNFEAGGSREGCVDWASREYAFKILHNLSKSKSAEQGTLDVIDKVFKKYINSNDFELRRYVRGELGKLTTSQNSNVHDLAINLIKTIE